MHDILVAFRSLRRTPGFAIAAVLILALGIGLSTAVFAVANSLLLRRLPVRDQNRLVVLSGEKKRGGIAAFPLSLDQSRDFAAQTRTLERTGSFMYEGARPVTAE